MQSACNHPRVLTSDSLVISHTQSYTSRSNVGLREVRSREVRLREVRSREVRSEMALVDSWGFAARSGRSGLTCGVLRAEFGFVKPNAALPLLLVGEDGAVLLSTFST